MLPAKPVMLITEPLLFHIIMFLDIVTSVISISVTIIDIIVMNITNIISVLLLLVVVVNICCAITSSCLLFIAC